MYDCDGFVGLAAELRSVLLYLGMLDEQRHRRDYNHVVTAFRQTCYCL